MQRETSDRHNPFHCSGFHTIQDGFCEDLAGATVEGNATIIITDGVAALLVKWNQWLVLQVLWDLFFVPDCIKQGLELPHRLSTTQLHHLSSDSIHSWGPIVLQLSDGSTDLLLGEWSAQVVKVRWLGRANRW